jgi:hypothetical protein
MAIIDEKLIEDAKIAAIREKTKVSAIVGGPASKLAIRSD